MIACSTFMREQIVDVFGVPESSIEVIPNGIDPDEIRPHDDAELQRLRAEFAEPDESLVLLVGRLVYEKGFQVALEALPEIIERLPKTRFVVAGSGTHEEELRRQAEELGLMKHGTFVGWIGDDVLHSLYAIADVCVVPRSTSPSASSRSRRWPRAARASWPTPEGCERSYPTTRWVSASVPGTLIRSPR